MLPEHFSVFTDPNFQITELEVGVLGFHQQWNSRVGRMSCVAERRQQLDGWSCIGPKAIVMEVGVQSTCASKPRRSARWPSASSMRCVGVPN